MQNSGDDERHHGPRHAARYRADGAPPSWRGSGSVSTLPAPSRKVVEPIPGNRPAERSWIFRSVGAGHPVEFWRDLVAALGEAGYDGALSIEHEDPLLSHADGLELAVTTLRAALVRRRLSAMPPEHSEVVVGLDVGTTGVKGIAVAPDGTVAAVAEHGYPLSTPARGLVGAGSGGLVARRRRSCSARWEPSSAARRIAGIGLTWPDARARRPR